MPKKKKVKNAKSPVKKRSHISVKTDGNINLFIVNYIREKLSEYLLAYDDEYWDAGVHPGVIQAFAKERGVQKLFVWVESEQLKMS